MVVCYLPWYHFCSPNSLVGGHFSKTSVVYTLTENLGGEDGWLWQKEHTLRLDCKQHCPGLFTQLSQTSIFLICKCGGGIKELLRGLSAPDPCTVLWKFSKCTALFKFCYYTVVELKRVWTRQNLTLHWLPYPPTVRAQNHFPEGKLDGLVLLSLLPTP